MYSSTVASNLWKQIEVYTYIDILSDIRIINKQFVWHVQQPRVVIPEFNKINAIKELLNVMYNFAFMPVLDLADIIFSFESLCIE